MGCIWVYLHGGGGGGQDIWVVFGWWFKMGRGAMYGILAGWHINCVTGGRIWVAALMVGAARKMVWWAYARGSLMDGGGG